MRRISVILAALLLSGCAAVNPVKVRQAVTLSKNLQHAATLWRMEARLHGLDPIILVAHGGTRNGKWVMQPDEGDPIPVEGAVKILKQVFPGRPILLIVCNPNHLTLKEPGVFYGKEDVWAMPDRFAVFRFPFEHAIGSIEEFEYNPCPALQSK